jgi:hypothetical protein
VCGSTVFEGFLEGATLAFKFLRGLRAPVMVLNHYCVPVDLYSTLLL